MSPVVIMIAGIKRSGKDTSAQLLKEALETDDHIVDIASFADPMKYILATILGITEEELDALKNNPDHPHRGYLQRLGTEAMKPIFGSNVWQELLSAKIVKSEADYFIVPDFRFPIEYGCSIYPYTVKVEREGLESVDTHSSETALEGFDFDYTLYNNGTLAELQEAINELKKDIYERTGLN